MVGGPGDRGKAVPPLFDAHDPGRQAQPGPRGRPRGPEMGKRVGVCYQGPAESGGGKSFKLQTSSSRETPKPKLQNPRTMRLTRSAILDQARLPPTFEVRISDFLRPLAALPRRR